MLDLYDNSKNHLPPIKEDQLTDAEVLVKARALKEELSDQMVVFGHHYQQDDVISFADITGDSLQLAKEAAKLNDKKYIVFCGVHFMAETADMLTTDHQSVILPDLRAGCSMADMANTEEIEKAWEFLTANTDEKIIPVTYINCSAELKAFVGRHGGSICTSSNAEKIIQWALDNGEKLLFFPDQHLGRNTCAKMGIPLDKMITYNPHMQFGGVKPNQIQDSKVILWYGYCSVHQGFQKSQIDNLRKTDPQRKIIVHPECSYEVVQASDLAGSTSYIINQIDRAPAGSKFAVGTEINLVNRLQQNYPALDIQSLSPYQCLCTTMYRVRPRWLLKSFQAIKEEKPINVIQVPKKTTDFALKALNTMLEIS